MLGFLYHRFCILASVLVLTVWSLQAQDLAAIGQQSPFSLHGGFDARLSIYRTSQQLSYYAPFGYALSANLTASIYGISMPFSLIYSDNNRQFSQPFNRIGVSPTYKWIKVHLGYRNVHFGKFSLAGHTFLGAGVELTPGLFRFGFIKGRFNKAIRNVQGLENFIGPQYDRQGMAMKIGVGSEDHYLDLSLMSAKDDATRNKLDTAAVTPAENAVIELQTHHRFYDFITFDVEIAASGYNENSNSEQIQDEFWGRNIADRIFRVRNNTDLRFAGEASLGVAWKTAGVSLGYKYIEPDFRSMGAYTFYNDIEDITFNPYCSVYRGKIRLNGSVGVQKNNLNRVRLQQSRRFIGNINSSLIINEKLTTSLAYSNFRSDILTVQEEFLSDSFDIYQVSEQYRINTQFKLRNQPISQNIGFSIFHQSYVSESEIVRIGVQKNRQSGLSMQYNQRNPQNKLGWNAGLNYSLTNNELLNSSRVSFRGGAQKSFSDVWIVRGFATVGYTDRSDDFHFWYSSVQCQSTYKLKHRQQLNIVIAYINRQQANRTSTSDVRLNFGYGISF